MQQFIENTNKDIKRHDSVIKNLEEKVIRMTHALAVQKVKQDKPVESDIPNSSNPVSNALTDLGVSISVIPFSMFKRLGLGNLKPVNMVIEMVDRSMQSPKGIVENVLDNDLLPNFDASDGISLSPSRLSGINRDPFGEFQDSDSNMGIEIDDFVKGMDNIWDDLDPGVLNNNLVNLPLKPEIFSVGNRVHRHNPYNLQITYKIGVVNFNPYIDLYSPFNIMFRAAYNYVMKQELVYTGNNIFVEKGLTEVLFGKPFKENIGLEEDINKGVLWLKIRDDKTVFNMPRAERKLGSNSKEMEFEVTSSRNCVVWKSIEYGVSKGLDTTYWGFLGVWTMFDIFQNIILYPYLEYGVLNFSGYGVLNFIPFVVFDAGDDVKIIPDRIASPAIYYFGVDNKLVKISDDQSSSLAESVAWVDILNYGVVGDISKRRAFWSLNKDILKITILKTNTPYPSRKRIRACTQQRPQTKQYQYAVSREDQYAVLALTTFLTTDDAAIITIKHKGCYGITAVLAPETFWTEPKPVKHTCKPFNYKTGCSEWPTCSWKNDRYCNEGNLPGAYHIRNSLHYQDLAWYEAVEDCELKDESLRNKAIMKGLISDDESYNDCWKRWKSHEINYHNHDEIKYENATHDEGQESCEARKPPVCNVRRFKMIKYSFEHDKEYVVVKEDKYDDLEKTNDDACRALMTLNNVYFIASLIP
ncbi:hypothetical protein Tco_0970676 [Tanacetum coccineum]